MFDEMTENDERDGNGEGEQSRSKCLNLRGREHQFFMAIPILPFSFLAFVDSIFGFFMDVGVV